MSSIIFNQTFHFVVKNYAFDMLPKAVVEELFKDGRNFAHFIERWIPITFPELKWVTGCKSHDFIDENGNKYDEKTFTTSSGCKFMPSSMIGTGRSFNQELFNEHANKMNYIIIDNIDFPNIKIKFMKGSELLQRFPNGKITLVNRNAFFID